MTDNIVATKIKDPPINHQDRQQRFLSEALKCLKKTSWNTKRN